MDKLKPFPEIIRDCILEVYSTEHGPVDLFLPIKESVVPFYCNPAEIVAIKPVVDDAVWIKDQEGALCIQGRCCAVLECGENFYVALSPSDMAVACGGHEFVMLPSLHEVRFQKTGWNEQGEHEVITPAFTITNSLFFRRDAIVAISSDLDFEGPGDKSVREDYSLLYLRGHSSGFMIPLPASTVYQRLTSKSEKVHAQA